MAKPIIRLTFRNKKAFEIALDDFIEKTVPDKHLRLQKKIALDLLSRIIEKAPVGNPSIWDGRAVGEKRELSTPPPGYVGGRSRSNWQISLGLPGTSSVIGIDSTGVSAEAAGVAAITGAKPYGTIWIFNNVRYIRRLEEGWSTQASAGMVAISLAEIEAGLGAL
jgi:hypothetical protein